VAACDSSVPVRLDLEYEPLDLKTIGRSRLLGTPSGKSSVPERLIKI
jgi:hypothetical protein